MIWLFRALRVPQLLIIASTTGILCGIFSTSYVLIPSLLVGALSPVPLNALLSLFGVAGVTRCWSALPWTVEASSVRPIRSARVALPLIFVVVIGLLALALSQSLSALVVVRISCGLIGLAGFGWWIRGSGGAVVLPTTYVMLCLLFSGGSWNAAVWLIGPPTLRSFTVPLALFVLGLWLQARTQLSQPKTE